MNDYFNYRLVSEAMPCGNGCISIVFDDGSHGVFDCTPYMLDPYWKQLKDESFFNTVRVDCGTLTWPNDIDIAPEEVWRGAKRGTSAADPSPTT